VAWPWSNSSRSWFLKLMEKGLSVDEIWNFPLEGEEMIQLNVAMDLEGDVL
jgi:hypothetical protein